MCIMLGGGVSHLAINNINTTLHVYNARGGGGVSHLAINNINTTLNVYNAGGGGLVI